MCRWRKSIIGKELHECFTTQAPGNQHDPRSTIIVRPALQDFRRVEYVLHAVQYQRFVKSGCVDDAFYAQELLTVLSKQGFHTAIQGTGVNGVFENKVACLNRTVPIDVVHVVAVMCMPRRVFVAIMM